MQYIVKIVTKEYGIDPAMRMESQSLSDSKIWNERGDCERQREGEQIMLAKPSAHKHQHEHLDRS